MKRSRLDLDMSMGFLTTRVSKSDVEDWGKSRWRLRFVQWNLKEKIYFEATSLD